MKNFHQGLKKLTQEQIKIIYISAVALLVFFLFWVLLYAPQARKFSSIKKEISDAESQIKDIEALIQGRELTEVAQELNIEFNKLSGMILSEEKDEEVIDNLSQDAKKFNIEVRDIRPASRVLFKYQVAGLNLVELPISMSLISESRDLGSYLRDLRDDFPVLLKFRRIEIRSDCEGCYRLNADLDISAYLSKR